MPTAFKAPPPISRAKALLIAFLLTNSWFLALFIVDGIGQYGQGAGKGGSGLLGRRIFHRISYFKGVKAFLMGFFKTPHKQAPKSTWNFVRRNGEV